jgi:hypothetical protein
MHNFQQEDCVIVMHHHKEEKEMSSELFAQIRVWYITDNTSYCRAGLQVIVPK